MKALEEIIGNLLLQHNCVVIPGFGGFVAKQLSAQIDYSNGVMTPPRKSLLFNKQLINNDGLLITELARESGLTYDQSSVQVAQAISDWTQQLQNGNRVTIDRVGYLFFDQEKNVCFEQDRYFNLLLESFGLGKVHFLTETDVEIAKIKVQATPVAIETPTVPVKEKEIVPLQIVRPESAETKVEETPVVALPTIEVHRKRVSLWKYVAAACVLPLAFYSVWIPMKTDLLESKMISFSDFNPFHKTPASHYNADEKLTVAPISEDNNYTSLEDQLTQLSASNETYTYNFSDETFITVNLPKTVDTETTSPKEITSTPVQSETVAPAHSLHYIVGCFSDADNARNLIQELTAKGFKAVEVDVKGGLHRVSCGGAFSNEALQKVIAQANAQGLQGWVLKK